MNTPREEERKRRRGRGLRTRPDWKTRRCDTREAPDRPAARGAAGGRRSCRRARTRAGHAEGSSGETTRPHASWARARRCGASGALRSAVEPRERRRARTGDAAAGENPRPRRRAARARDDASARSRRRERALTSRTRLVTSCARARGVGPRRRGADARAAARSVPPKTPSRGWKSRCARGVPCRCCGSTAPGRPRTPARAHP